MFYKLQVNVNGEKSYIITGNVPDSRKLIDNFKFWASTCKPDLIFQDLEFKPLRCQSKTDFKYEFIIESSF